MGISFYLFSTKWISWSFKVQNKICESLNSNKSTNFFLEHVCYWFHQPISKIDFVSIFCKVYRITVYTVSNTLYTLSSYSATRIITKLKVIENSCKNPLSWIQLIFLNKDFKKNRGSWILYAYKTECSSVNNNMIDYKN